jgi:hypothetical protein
MKATNWVELRERVLMRCGGYCEKCGGGLEESFALHHRKLKSRGGKDTIDNLLALHHQCHNLGTNSVHLNVKIAEENGWIISAYKNPSECPVTLGDKSIVTLSEEGTYIYLEASNGW